MEQMHRITLPPPARRALLIVLFSLGAAVAVAKGGFNANAPLLPDVHITPGDALAVTARDVCTLGYAGKVRNVPQAVKEQAYKNYGITSRAKGEYEVDHLISLELGGSNSIKNLWPQSFKTMPWNAHVKDKLENAYHDDICSNKIDIKTAQTKIAGNWIAAYKERFPDDSVSKNPVPAPGAARPGFKLPFRNPFARPVAANTPTPNTVPPSVSPGGNVWVNLSSKVYWRPGTPYYGKTKRGKYMSEADAVAAGYHAAENQ